MRIAHVIGSYPPARFHGGPIASASRLCAALARAGHHVRVLTTDADGPGRIAVPLDRWVMHDGVEVRYCRTLTDRPLSPRLLARLPALLDWAQLVHVTGVYEHHTLPALALCRLRGRPLVWSPRGSLQRWSGEHRLAAKAAWERACRLLLPARTRLHVTAEAEAEHSRARMPGVGVAVVANGVQLPPPCPPSEPSEATAPLSLVFLGRLHPIKAIDRLLQACALLAADGVPLSLRIAGEGAADYVAELRALAEQLQVPAELIGRVDGEAKQRLLCQADVLVLPSHRENFGMVVLEALAAGTPVLAARGTPWQQLPVQGCGAWVDNEPPALAAALAELRHAPLTEMGRRGRRWVAEHYGWSEIARRMADVYADLIAEQEAG